MKACAFNVEGLCLQVYCLGRLRPYTWTKFIYAYVKAIFSVKFLVLIHFFRGASNGIKI